MPPFAFLDANARRTSRSQKGTAAVSLDLLPAGIDGELPGVSAQTAALRLPLDAAKALGETKEEHVLRTCSRRSWTHSNRPTC